MDYIQFKDILSKHANIPSGSILDTDLIRDNLGIDSLQMVNLIFELTDQYGIELNSIESFDQIKTVKGMFEILINP